jgi:hypothetical protein
MINFKTTDGAFSVVQDFGWFTHDLEVAQTPR